MPTRSKPALTLAVERHRLDNGLRVVVSPDRSAPVVGIAVYYDVGFRSEPEGRTGFAHLFEHLMFQGSVSLEKGEHSKLVQGNGGNFNGSTNTDYTNYFEELPSEALEVGLFLEADRMRGPRITEENLQNQISVVKEEIRVNVLNRPYGGFPWIRLPAVMFRTFNNSHNGYGSFEDLESATVEDAEDFFARYYAPANAVVSVVGDVDGAAAIDLVERHFGSIDARPAPTRPDFDEPPPGAERREVVEDPLAPSPAVALGYRVPDPLGDVGEYVAAVLAVEVLSGGDPSRLYQRVVKQERRASHLFGYTGLFGDPFETRHPTMAQVMAYYTDGGPDPLLELVDDEVSRLVKDGLADGELDRVRNSYLSGYLQGVDKFMSRGLALAVLEQQRDRPELVNELPALVEQVTPADIVVAADTWLRPEHRAVLDIQPGGQR